MSGPYVVRGSVSLPEAELVWRFSRSSGPGGQHVNTTDTQVEVRFDLAATEALPEVWKRRALERLGGRLVDGVLSVRASEHRSQWRNREAAAVRLAALLAEATAPPPKPRRPTRIPRESTKDGCGRRSSVPRPSGGVPAAAGSEFARSARHSVECERMRMQRRPVRGERPPFSTVLRGRACPYQSPAFSPCLSPSPFAGPFRRPLSPEPAGPGAGGRHPRGR